MKSDKKYVSVGDRVTLLLNGYCLSKATVTSFQAKLFVSLAVGRNGFYAVVHRKQIKPGRRKGQGKWVIELRD